MLTEQLNKVIKMESLRTLDTYVDHINTNSYHPLLHISDKLIYYADKKLSINMIPVLKLHNTTGIYITHYICIPVRWVPAGYKNKYNSLDMYVVSFDEINYKCNCHHKKCKEYFSCKGLCKKKCECGGILLPTITNFKPFIICEGHCDDDNTYIKINTHEEYLKYVSIPYIFRYKHKYINDDLSIDFGKYIKKSVQIDTKYKFTINEKIMVVSTNDDEYPFSDEVLEMCIKYVHPVIEEVLVKPEYSENMYQDIEMIKNLIRKHITSSIGIAFNV